MPRKPSSETELRTLRREFRETDALKNAYQREATVLRGQLNKAQAETGEWKRRFDQLLLKCKGFEPPSVSEEAKHG